MQSEFKHEEFLIKKGTGGQPREIGGSLGNICGSKTKIGLLKGIERKLFTQHDFLA